ncbi:hypothetical protein T10_9967 [Trichinella papuae]|uniref:Uncharacterized protein n=1 Tax=Trichinella papuae TaxID=268474 RepID=A0A0V1N3R0_9BILA|nr:hypothetical protein T10_9967 [Trichinella papuae]
MSGRVDDRQEAGLLQASTKRNDLCLLRGRETSLLRQESDGQARPDFFQSIRFISENFRYTPPSF